MKAANRIISRAIVVISVVFCAWFFFVYGKEQYPFYGDSMGYYMYLPSTFIYHNHKALDWLPPGKHLDNSVRSYVKILKEKEARTPRGYIINKYTYGVAALEMPFFFAAHAYEKMSEGEANGYSASYRVMLKVSALFYALFGLVLLYKVLKSFFSPDLSLWGTLLLFMGTNLFWFTLSQAGMAHVPLFFLYALLAYLTILVSRSPRLHLFFLAGITAGFITVIRPTDIICLLIPALYNVYDKETARQKIQFLSMHLKGIMLFVAAFIVPIIPQLLYWKKFAGSFFYYSYGKESFNWLHPQIGAGLFSFSNGWLVYTPVMGLALVGILFYKAIKPVVLLLCALLPLYVYVVYSWYCYNYINGLGSRPMIHLYPLLAIPLTALLARVARAKLMPKIIVYAVIFLFVAVNISYSLQMVRGVLISEESNRVYTLNMLFKMSATYSDMVMYDVEQVQPAEGKVEKMATLACRNYDDSAQGHYVPASTGDSSRCFHMRDDEEYHPVKVLVTYNKQQFDGAQWIKCSGMFMCTKPYLYFKHLFTLDIARGGKTLSWAGCKIDNKIGLAEPGAPKGWAAFSHNELNKWGQVYFYIKVPGDLNDGDNIRLEVWNIGKQEIYFDNICLELYRGKN